MTGRRREAGLEPWHIRVLFVRRGDLEILNPSPVLSIRTFDTNTLVSGFSRRLGDGPAWPRWGSSWLDPSGLSPHCAGAQF